jgi:ElaB/YqjD/DUF883 family membrane-anchored ribosome-binding protein
MEIHSEGWAADVMKDVVKEHEREIRLVHHSQKKAEEATRAAQLRIEAMEQEASNLRTRIQKEVSEGYEMMMRTKDAQIEQAKQATEKAYEVVGKKVESLQNSMTKTYASSKEKGALGETIMEALLKKAFDCSVQVVSTDPQSADIRMTRAAAAYLWEVKNYSRLVTSDEVEKFRRDLRLHPDVKGGVLVSLRQGIVGHARGGDIDLEFLEDGRFILFVSSFLSHDDPVFYLQTLRPFFEAVESIAKPVKEEVEAVRALELKASLMTNLLRSHAGTVTRHKNSLAGHKKRTDTMFAEFQGFILEAEAQLQTVLRVALGGDTVRTEVGEDARTMLSPAVFRKDCLAEFADDKLREFIKWLLAEVEVREGTQVEIKDLIEKGKARNFSEKFLRGLREEVFQEASWSKGSRFIQGMRWKTNGVSQ